jgi:hypothetical protein
MHTTLEQLLHIRFAKHAGISKKGMYAEVHSHGTTGRYFGLPRNDSAANRITEYEFAVANTTAATFMPSDAVSIPR